jgi:hypothetical protein
MVDVAKVKLEFLPRTDTTRNKWEVLTQLTGIVRVRLLKDCGVLRVSSSPCHRLITAGAPAYGWEFSVSDRVTSRGKSTHHVPKHSKSELGNDGY